VESGSDQHRGVQGFKGALALACSSALGLWACGNDDVGPSAPGGGAASGGTVATGGNGVAGNAAGGNGAGKGGGGAGTNGGGATNPGGANASGGVNTGGSGAGSAGAPSGGAGPGGAQAFLANAPFYQDISKAKLDDESAKLIAALDAIGWGDAGKRTTLGIDFSFNINTAELGLAPRAFTKAAGFYSPDCDSAPVPLPIGGKGEGVDNYTCGGGDDCHLFVYQSTRLFELYQSNITGGLPLGGTFTAKCLVVWDLTKDYWVAQAPPNYSRGDGCTGADAAGLPMAPLVLTKQDIASGNVKHALRFTIDNNRIAETVYVHPATHLGGPTGGSDMLPYGARLRLRGDYDLASLPNANARTVAKALQTYGMYLSDGGNIYVSATADAVDLINNSILTALKPRDFEMVDGGARIDAGSQDCKHVPITQ
jgi:hypothetical protein